jgi:hypothetical protein
VLLSIWSCPCWLLVCVLLRIVNFRPFVHFLIALSFVVIKLHELCVYLAINPYQTCFTNIFLHSVDCLFILLLCGNFLVWCNANYLFLHLLPVLFGIIFKKLLPRQMLRNFPLCFLQLLKSLIHFKLTCMWCKIRD